MLSWRKVWFKWGQGWWQSIVLCQSLDYEMVPNHMKKGHKRPLHSMLQAWHTGLLWGAKQGPKRQRNLKVPAKYIKDLFDMYCQCIRNVSWMYYVSTDHVSFMYYGCIWSCTPHLCFPPYSAHHLFGAQPIRASSFGNQQPMGMAPGGWGQPWHGSTRHAFWPAGHGCSSMTCWVLSSRNHCWAGIHMGPLRSMLQAWHTGLLWRAKQGPKDSEKYQLSI